MQCYTENQLFKESGKVIDVICKSNDEFPFCKYSITIIFERNILELKVQKNPHSFSYFREIQDYSFKDLIGNQITSLIDGVSLTSYTVNNLASLKKLIFNIPVHYTHVNAFTWYLFVDTKETDKNYIFRFIFETRSNDEWDDFSNDGKVIYNWSNLFYLPSPCISRLARLIICVGLPASGTSHYLRNECLSEDFFWIRMTL